MRKRFLSGSHIAAILFLHAFTATAQTVVGPGELLSVTSSTEENFLLNGGTLEPTNVTLSGSIGLQDDSRIIRPQNALVLNSVGILFEPYTGPTTLNGPISGAGDLELGNLSRDQILISGANTYDGHTFITSGEIVATSATALARPSVERRSKLERSASGRPHKSNFASRAACWTLMMATSSE